MALWRRKPPFYPPPVRKRARLRVNVTGIICIFGLLFCGGAHADKMVNVEYIHKLIEQRWGIVIPYSPKLSTPKVAANMKYLLTLVDMTNRRINGTVTTDYGNGEFATMVAADTVAANTAITKLARIKPKFTITTTPDTAEFTFRMSAKGRFMVDWGDNTATEIVRTDTKNTTYTHKYKRAGEYKIKMTGLATGYSTGANVAAISFAGTTDAPNTTIAGISGSLGAIFGTIGDGDGPGQQPKFYTTFYNCSDMAGTIPTDLFTGVHGAPVSYMFSGLFSRCGKLTGSIPATLFAGLDGAPAEYLFSGTFEHCRGLTGSIPADLFVGIQGQPAPAMFNGTFLWCSGLSGEIPETLFAGISGEPANNMFSATFLGNRGLTGSIPAGLFSKISGRYAKHMYHQTFYYCNGLTGSIPTGLFGTLYGAPAENMFSKTFAYCQNLTGEIPGGLFGEPTGVPAKNMFNNTFIECYNLTGSIPDDLFGNISGPAVDGMFVGTFRACFKLSGPSAKIGTEYLYNIWPNATYDQVGSCYISDSKLSDYEEIPEVWKIFIDTDAEDTPTATD